MVTTCGTVKLTTSEPDLGTSSCGTLTIEPPDPDPDPEEALSVTCGTPSQTVVEDEAVTISAIVENSSSVDIAAVGNLLLNGPEGSEPITVPAGGSTDLSFEVVLTTPGSLAPEVRVTDAAVV